ncbi:T9SS type A sorting domain-containing protein [Vicingaceae bacterium]|nr:T9SS type A sorting domain-containing protein [Vicingaceae bacterium]
MLAPNPVVDKLTISVDDRIDRIQIYNIKGQLQKEFQMYNSNKKKHLLNLVGLKQGIYIVIVSNDVFQMQGKFVNL